MVFIDLKPYLGLSYEEIPNLSEGQRNRLISIKMKEIRRTIWDMSDDVRKESLLREYQGIAREMVSNRLDTLNYGMYFEKWWNRLQTLKEKLQTNQDL